MKKQTVKVILSAVLVLIAVCFIFSNSLLNGEESNRQSGLVMKLLRSIFDPTGNVEEDTFHYYVRKGAHFTEFFLLGCTLWWLLLSIQDRFGVFCPGVMLFAALATAVADEFIQLFTGRTSSVTDVLIDFGGALAGFVLLLAFGAILKKRNKEKNNAAKECGTE